MTATAETVETVETAVGIAIAPTATCHVRPASPLAKVLKNAAPILVVTDHAVVWLSAAATRIPIFTINTAVSAVAAPVAVRTLAPNSPSRLGGGGVIGATTIPFITPQTTTAVHLCRRSTATPNEGKRFA